jgi:arylsulfatase A-like enzyme
MTPPPTPARPNVLLIVLDDIGLEWFEIYGIGARFTTDRSFSYCRTPVLDELAANGLLFEQGHANPICGPTRAGIQTGRFAFRSGFGQNVRDPGTSAPVGYRLTDRFPWLPEAIHAGLPGAYETAAIGKWHLCDGYSEPVAAPWPAPDANLDHAGKNGYEFSAIHMPNYGGAFAWYRVVNGAVDPPGGFTAPPFGTQSWAPSVHVDDALAWIGTRTKPWFMHLAFNAPHAPFTVPPFSTLSSSTVGELEEAGLAPGFSWPEGAAYAQASLTFRAAMESVDHEIGRLLRGMPSSVRASTNVIVTGDNGTVGNMLPPGFVHAKREPHGGGTRVPLIAQGPSAAAKGRRTPALAHTVDLYATILDLVGAPIPPGARFDSRSLAPLLAGGSVPRRMVYSEIFGPLGQVNQVLQESPQRMIFDGRWRYVTQPRGNELYDDVTDPLEASNVIEANPAIAAHLAAEMAAILAS